MAKAIMLQGTSSHVGKSVLTAALCRIFRQDGFAAVPFKAQNMALNSYVTPSGEEMGRAQVAQAEAAGLPPAVEMNPVLLKPVGNARSQVILMGRPVATLTAKEYHEQFAPTALNVIEQCLEKLHAGHEIIVIEGAGSPAEVNLKKTDIVNMRIARMAPSPVLLVADIDRGGALAAVVGTLELLEPAERDMVAGIIINKFRGDMALLKPGLEFLEQRTGKPVIGVIPYFQGLRIAEEDSVSLDAKLQRGEREDLLEIAVLRTPKIANFTDFDPLEDEPDVFLRYVNTGEEIGRPDLLLLAGSKNTIEDLLYIKEQGYAREIIDLVKAGMPVIGICGGYQMLGKEIHDPYHTETDQDRIDGLGLLPTSTTFAREKTTHQIEADSAGCGLFGESITTGQLTGYEIHTGHTDFLDEVAHPFHITRRSRLPVDIQDGVMRADGLVMGTYIHGIFENDLFRRGILNQLRVHKGWRVLPASGPSTRRQKEDSYDKLAATVRQNIDLPRLYALMELTPGGING